MCIKEAPSLWPPGTVCQHGLRAWAQSNASSWHCAYDTSNSLNCVQLTVKHVLIFFFNYYYYVWFSACFSCVLYITMLVFEAHGNMMLAVERPPILMCAQELLCWFVCFVFLLDANISYQFQHEMVSHSKNTGTVCKF